MKKKQVKLKKNICFYNKLCYDKEIYYFYGIRFNEKDDSFTISKYMFIG